LCCVVLGNIERGLSTLRVLIERSLEHNQEVYICSVDYEKAFDKVDEKTDKCIEKDGS